MSTLWMYTWNNPGTCVQDWMALLDTRQDLEYWCFGVEQAPTTGTKHYQGMLRFNGIRSIPYLIKHLGKGIYYAPWNVGSEAMLVAYCRKDGEWYDKI